METQLRSLFGPLWGPRIGGLCKLACRRMLLNGGRLSLRGGWLGDRLARVALYAIQVFGTFPPLAASWRMTSLWSQTFILDEPFVFPE